jgi:hypothetical protein
MLTTCTTVHFHLSSSVLIVTLTVTPTFILFHRADRDPNCHPNLHPQDEEDMMVGLVPFFDIVLGFMELEMGALVA